MVRGSSCKRAAGREAVCAGGRAQWQGGAAHQVHGALRWTVQLLEITVFELSLLVSSLCLSCHYLYVLTALLTVFSATRDSLSIHYSLCLSTVFIGDYLYHHCVIGDIITVFIGNYLYPSDNIPRTA